MSALREPRLRWLRCGLLAMGLGLLAGACEALQIGFDIRLDLTFGQAFLLSLTSAACGGAMGFGVGIVAGLALTPFGGRVVEARVYTIVMAAAAFFVSGFYLWNAALLLLEAGRPPAAAAMAACPMGFAGVIWFNASYWARRESVGAETKIGWLAVSALGALALSAVGGWLGSATAGSGVAALTGDPNVLLITVDTLRRDHVSAYGEGRASTPRMDALAKEGLLFTNAITPIPETAPAHATMMTALHPLRHEVISNGHRLRKPHITLAERLRGEGYATGAFLSSFAVNARTGLGQGFDVFEDDFVPVVHGFSQILFARYLLRAVMVLGDPADFPWLLERLGPETNRLASAWIRDRGDKPWFAWVHYFEPHAPYEGPDATVDHREFLKQRDPTYTEAEAAELRRLYAHEAGLADALVGEMLDLLDDLEVADNTLVIVTADHGEQLGEHDIWFHHHNLYDESLRIPLIIRAPGEKLARNITTRVIDQQVRLQDIAPTVLDYLHLDPMEPSEGAPLLEYAKGLRKRSIPSTLFGRRTASLSEGTLIGLRATAKLTLPIDEDAAPEEKAKPEDMDIKYILDPASGGEELYNLVVDPGEAADLTADQAELIGQLRARASEEIGQAADLAPDIDPAEIEALRAMGYME